MTSEGPSAPEGPRLPGWRGEHRFGGAKRKLLKRRGHGPLHPQGKATLELTTSLALQVRGQGLSSPALYTPGLERQGVESGSEKRWGEEVCCFTFKWGDKNNNLVIKTTRGEASEDFAGPVSGLLNHFLLFGVSLRWRLPSC